MRKTLLIFTLLLAFFSSNAQTNDAYVIKEKKAIIIYGSPDCHHCIDTKKFLTEHKVDFIFCDIDHDKTAEDEMIRKLTISKISLSDVRIPVIDKNGEIFQNNGNFEEFLKELIE